MNLPNAHLAKVDRQKIADYLLNSAHPDNGGKANFFLGLGFTVENGKCSLELCGDLAARFR